MLWIIVKYLTLIVIKFAVLITYLWFYKPSVLLRWASKLALYNSGLKEKSIKGRSYTYRYAERGERTSEHSSILLLHGFSATKDMMVPVVRKLPRDIHVIIVDLPGHGGTSMPGQHDEVSAEQFADDLYEFTKLVELTSAPFHLFGTSLGGVICYLYAIQHSHLLDRLTLVCPAFDTPISTKFMEEVRRGECRLIPTTVNEMTHMLHSCFYNKDALPKQKQIIQGSLDLRLPKNPFFQRLFESLNRDIKDKDKHERLESRGVNIKCPVQLIWGKHDELVHISGVDKLKSLIPSIQRVDIFENCGHSVTMEHPGKTVKCILQFRGAYKNKDE